MEIEKKSDEIVKEKAKELIRKHKKYIGEDVAEKAIKKIEKEEKSKDDKDTNVEKKEELEDGIVQEKGKRGRTRRKA